MNQFEAFGKLRDGIDSLISLHGENKNVEYDYHYAEFIYSDTIQDILTDFRESPEIYCEAARRAKSKTVARFQQEVSSVDRESIFTLFIYYFREGHDGEGSIEVKFNQFCQALFG